MLPVPLSEPRGLPKDMNPVYKKYFENNSLGISCSGFKLSVKKKTLVGRAGRPPRIGNLNKKSALFCGFTTKQLITA
jgi:hypothetical protein